MITYRPLKKACKELGLNPDLFGDNPFVGGHRETFDLGTINFPEKHLKQVVMIGQIILNLRSQSQSGLIYNFETIDGKERFRRDRAIKEIMPILQQSIQFWLKTGLIKCKSDKNLFIRDGEVIEFNQKQMDKILAMNSYNEGVDRDTTIKEVRSSESAGHIILTQRNYMVKPFPEKCKLLK